MVLIPLNILNLPNVKNTTQIYNGLSSIDLIWSQTSIELLNEIPNNLPPTYTLENINNDIIKMNNLLTKNTITGIMYLHINNVDIPQININTSTIIINDPYNVKILDSDLERCVF